MTFCIRVDIDLATNPFDAYVVADIFQCFGLSTKHAQIEFLSQFEKSKILLRYIDTPFGQRKMICIACDIVDDVVNMKKNAIHYVQPSSAIFCVSGTEYAAKEFIALQFCAWLKQRALPYRQHVRCKYGIIDLVTHDSLFEIVGCLTFQTFNTAFAQLTAYRTVRKNVKKLYILGCSADVKELRKIKEFTAIQNVSLILYDDWKFRVIH